jgi:L-lysine 2,3-aminomutase
LKYLAASGVLDLYVEDQCPAYVRYCFEEAMDAAIFRSRFEPKVDRFKLAS